jgi:DNA-binding NarL/FixJ family response regulator
MRVFWESIGILLPVYRLVGRGLSDGDIATKLKLPQLNVEGCVGWLLHFLELKDRSELVQYAAAGAST